VTARELAWGSQPLDARVYVAACIAGGAAAFALIVPLAPARPMLLLVLVAASSVTSSWKVSLPIAPASGSTLSVSYAANLTALLLLGAGEATVVAVAGVLAQCTVNVTHRYPWYRTIFSMSAEAMTMALTGLVYLGAGGGAPPTALALLCTPLEAAIAA
jgi:hypothetical protein